MKLETKKPQVTKEDLKLCLAVLTLSPGFPSCQDDVLTLMFWADKSRCWFAPDPRRKPGPCWFEE